MHDGLPVIDVHVHLAPARLAAAVRAALLEQYSWRLAGPLEPDAVLAVIRAGGADLCVTLPYAHRAGIAASLNEHAVALARRHPDVVPFATVHPDDDDPAALLEAALAAGARGLKLHCVVQRVTPDDPRLAAVMALCAREGVPVLAHAGHAPDASTPHTGVAPVARLLERHPRLRLCVAHAGAPEAGAFATLAARYESVWLDLAGVANRILDLGARLEELLAQVDRFCYGSDYPNIELDPSVGLGALAGLGLSRADLAGVLAGNASRFLGISLPRPAGGAAAAPG